MRRPAAATALVFALSACGGASVDSITERIDERFDCLSIRTYETVRTCNLAGGAYIMVDEASSDDFVNDLTIAMRRDAGALGPWIVGDGFVVEVSSGDMAFAMRVQAITGGEVHR